MDREERRQFVRDHRTCIFGYNRKNDGPAMTVVYYVMDGDDLLVSTMADRAKAKAVQRDPNVSLCVLDENWPITYLQVYGKATFDPDPERGARLFFRVTELMAGKPMPEDKFPAIKAMCEREKRVTVRVTPYATFETPPRHVYQADDIDGLTHFTSKSLDW